MNCDHIQLLVDDLLAKLKEQGVVAQAVYTITTQGYIASVRIDILERLD